MENFTVYKHTSPNGKVYIGITKRNPLRRWNNGKGYSGQPKFYNAILKYGWDNFKHEILFTDLTEEEACAKEKELIQFYDSVKSGYNASTGGKYASEGACKYCIGDVYGDLKIIGREGVKLRLQCLKCGAEFTRYSSCVASGSARCKCKNKRVYNRNSKPRERVYIPYNGKTQTVQEWAKELKIPEATIRTRYKSGWPIGENRFEKREDVKCAFCGEEFHQRWKGQKYCSTECRDNSMKAERPTKICEQCGKEFKPTRATNKEYQARFCSHECQINSMRKVV